MKHKYANIIKAWADGETVQYLDKLDNSCWQDMPQEVGIWSSSFKYRIKPEPIRYRVALMASESGEYLGFAVSQLEEEAVSENPNLVRWLTEWIEVVT